jgi:O-Antigen ligase
MIGGALRRCLGAVEWSWQGWATGRAVRYARWLVLVSGGLLFLHAAATIELVYTLRPSQLLLALAAVAGLPLIWHGWMRTPVGVRWLACGLLATYVVSLLLGDGTVLPSQTRGSSYRDVAYVADLTLGLGIVGLIVSLWGSLASTRLPVAVMVIGAIVAALYALYQWPSQRFGWPLQDINNAVNSDGVTTGYKSQGPGLFGWDRARGTFIEPHFLGTYLAMMLPLCLSFFVASRGERLRYLGIAAAALMIAGLVVTSSVSSAGVLGLGVVTGLTAFCIATGRSGHAALAAAVLVGALVLTPVVLASPEPLAAAAGRSESELELTVHSRLENWEQSLHIWQRDPVLGQGPGQSSVEMAYEPDGLSLQEEAPTPLVLETADGLWAAALIDGGVVGFTFWLLFLGSVLVMGARALFWRPTALMLGLFSSAVVAVLATMVAGDRMELRVWVILGLVLAAARSYRMDGGMPVSGSR